MHMQTGDLSLLKNWNATLPHTAAMPVLFLGHGSPMNAIQDNEFTREWNRVGATLETPPTAILCISAHWLTQGGTAVTAMQMPRTIHDFGGFPQALFDMQYPASGNQALVDATVDAIQSIDIHHDHEWGLDHGTWAVLCHVFPDANIPVVQLSIDYSQGAQYHYDLAKQLAGLRRKGVLIVASGNLVHNLGRVAFDKINHKYGFDWALEADQKMQSFLLARNHQALIDWDKQGTAFKLAIPTPDHYYPMIYALALQEDKDELSLFNAKAVGGSLTMTSFRLDQFA
ncbi:4,5-DOPA dioxygenase extradiol [Acinetobacter cumulans]|uniref:4,5-DOPA dioxygenase extradiol n=1 Tax=Acinetobacter cumulans TaxID=2136182 RepID=A0A498CVH8_9GAMM|nr:4,5-DOPA dioxygenase extradiol [Acinetobacter cumulans]RLL34781.1 4,5-DOPA dioxygenase extradiol [Acinetobacter cumulans]RLL44335.1 4,5-DOPA dioxygenase extradiol [Acinetobacter cumulans]